MSIAGAVAIARPVQVKTADSDPTRIVGGSVNIGTSAGNKLADGPLILTDLLATDSSESTQARRAALFVDSTDPKDCHGFDDPIAMVVMGSANITDMHGARLLVPAGGVLCARYIGGLTSPAFTWSGFRPYE